MKVKVATLYDLATVKCSNNDRTMVLSVYKVLEKDESFYERFGFELKIDRANHFDLQSYGSEEKMLKRFKKAVSTIKKIKISYYVDLYKQILDIFNQVIKNQDYDKLRIYQFNKTKPYLTVNTRQYVMHFTNAIDELLSYFKNTKHELLVDFLMDAMKKDCTVYSEIEHLIIDNLLYGIEYGTTKIHLKNIEYFNDLMYIIRNALFQIQLNK